MRTAKKQQQCLTSNKKNFARAVHFLYISLQLLLHDYNVKLSS